MSEMTAEQREAMLKRADAFGTAPDHWREILHALTERGFVVTHPDIRDHETCERCEGTGVVRHSLRYDRPGAYDLVPCPGGSVVAWTVNQ